MIDKHKIDTLLLYYKMSSNYEIDDAGIVHVDGSVYCDRLPKTKRMPVQFGRVTGDFVIARALQPLSLKGCPSYVGKWFAIEANNGIDSLEHGPQQVDDSYTVEVGNPIKSLKGIASHVGKNLNIFTPTLKDLADLPANLKHVYVAYNKHLPVLRLLTAERAYVQNATVGMQQILSKYEGQGRAGAIMCAAELIKAGYKLNARW